MGGSRSRQRRAARWTEPPVPPLRPATAGAADPVEPAEPVGPGAGIGTIGRDLGDKRTSGVVRAGRVRRPSWAGPVVPVGGVERRGRSAPLAPVMPRRATLRSATASTM